MLVAFFSFIQKAIDTNWKYCVEDFLKVVLMRVSFGL